MNDEARQVNDFIAEKVMGWHKYSLAGGDAWVTKYYLPHEPLIDDKDIVWCNHYDPFHNVSQAIEAFQVAVTKKLIHHLYSLNEIIFCYDERRGNWLVQRIDCQDYSDTLLGYNQSLATAICLALVAAVEGAK